MRKLVLVTLLSCVPIVEIKAQLVITDAIAGAPMIAQAGAMISDFLTGAVIILIPGSSITDASGNTYTVAADGSAPSDPATGNPLLLQMGMKITDPGTGASIAIDSSCLATAANGYGSMSSGQITTAQNVMTNSTTMVAAAQTAATQATSTQSNADTLAATIATEEDEVAYLLASLAAANAQILAENVIMLVRIMTSQLPVSLSVLNTMVSPSPLSMQPITDQMTNTVAAALDAQQSALLMISTLVQTAPTARAVSIDDFAGKNVQLISLATGLPLIFNNGALNYTCNPGTVQVTPGMGIFPDCTQASSIQVVNNSGFADLNIQGNLLYPSSSGAQLWAPNADFLADGKAAGAGANCTDFVLSGTLVPEIPLGIISLGTCRGNGNFLQSINQLSLPGQPTATLSDVNLFIVTSV